MGNERTIEIETPKGAFTVWTSRVGEHPRKKLLLLHGGPGATHEGFEIFEQYFQPDESALLLRAKARRLAGNAADARSDLELALPSLITGLATGIRKPWRRESCWRCPKADVRPRRGSSGSRR